MKWHAKIIIKIREFFRKYKNVILVVVIAFAVMIAVNYFLKNMETPEIPITTYKPNVSVMDDKEVPEELQEPIKNLIDEYMEYCNNKEYEKAYNLLDKECKDTMFPTVEALEMYVNKIFPEKKIYNIQNFSIVGSTYVYKVKILNDILASGLTNEEYNFYEEVMSITDDKDGLRLGIYGFVRKDDMTVVAEDDNLKINVNKKVTLYSSETYEVSIRNKTDHIIVLLDDTEASEVEINIGAQTRKMSNTTGNSIIIPPKHTVNRKLSFPKFVDDGRTTEKLIFNNIRVLESYSGNLNNKQAELDNAIKLYSLNISI